MLHIKYSKIRWNHSVIFLFCLWVFLFLMMQNPVTASALTTGQENIVARADYYYNTKWTVQKNVKGWRDENIFYAGETHHIPYGQPISSGRYIGWGVSMDKFLESTRDPDSVFYQSRSVNNYDTGSYSTFYATDCSAFASYCWNLPQRTTTGTFPSLNVKSYGKCTEENIPSIQVGDVLNKAYSHVVVVTDINYYEDGSIASIEITEQTVPEMKRSCYSVTQLEAHFGSYTIYRYVKRESVPPPPASSHENWYDSMETADLGEVFYARLKLHSGESYVTVSENSILSRQLDSDHYEQQIWKFERQTNGSYSISSVSDSFASSGNSVMTLAGEWLGMYGAEIKLDRKQIGIQQNYRIYQDSGKNCYYIRPESTDLPLSLNRVIYSPNRDDFENPDEIADFIINFEDSLMLSRFEPDSEKIQFDILRLDMDGCFPADLGETFCAGIRNLATGWFVTAQEQNITGLPEDHSQSQIWEFTRQADGSYQICNPFTKQCMEVQDFAVQGVDSNIFPGEYTGTTAQHYYIYSADGVYYLKPVCSELYVDMAQDTGNLAVWTRHPQWQPQQFDLQIFPDGDMDLDGAVTVLDVIMLQKWLLQTGDLTYWKNADVHKDQQIDIFDLVTLKYQLIHSGKSVNE